ncbi:iron-containing alcohol dehydrogenase family protein [Gloeocapsa sp. PCC 73106]|uniref:iron-containing alcohol dehydrogenase family protein n=1 Tax=Gloeocapsa sp. PCC 73106 TaxID=102232 RepID=UPI0002AD1880|nr:iron-containing alcohol dehydrogenase family protein [Gloeocapsa sp. PCC 73106]ELR96215.1 glycerol dehydrogenase-like oxidoreductase [Gloeocapsa sp. PCC 73106]
MKQTQKAQLIPLLVAPSQVIKGEKILPEAVKAIAPLGKRPLLLGGETTQSLISREIEPLLQQLTLVTAKYSPDCSEASLEALRAIVVQTQADLVIGVGGGKALDTSKLLAHQCKLPVVTIPTSGATCAAWTALANVYTNEGAFQYDVPLTKSPELLILDYDLLKNAPQRTLVAGIGDALAKWYEASVSSGNSTATLTIAAVQQARILRDILLQKSVQALENPGGEDWKEVIDATILLAGVIGGLGGANCRTVAAHAVHNGLTHLHSDYPTLHGEKVAYGILVQLRLEEMLQNNQLAVSAREQLLQFYGKIGLPQTLADLGLEQISLAQLRTCAEIICQANSDIHRLPFKVMPEQLMAAMVSTKARVKV